MDGELCGAIALASTINSALPGPCAALTLGSSATRGVRAGIVVSLGILSAKVLVATLAVSTMAGVVTLSEGPFVLMKWIGVAILFALAAKMLLRRPSGHDCAVQRRQRTVNDLCTGLLVGLSSPFNLVFLLALLPQMVEPADLDVFGCLAIVTAVMLGAAVSQFGLAVLGGVSGLLAGGVGRRIEQIGALSLLGFAALILASPIAHHGSPVRSSSSSVAEKWAAPPARD